MYRTPALPQRTVRDSLRWIEHGFVFVTVGYDAWFMLNGAHETLRNHGRL